MSISKKYREIYNEKIIQLNNGIIMTYDTLEDRFFFKPFSHGSEDNSIERLGKLMRSNLIFYCFGEQEILEYHEKNRLDNLEHAAIFAYESRSPKRNSNKDGLPGEILLDLLVQIYDRNAYKLTVRHLHRSDDKNEIKGYDLTYFVKSDNKISIWLGQSKMGRKLYCKNGIRHDLSKKYKGKYLAKQLFFVSDKPTPTTEESKEILEIINQINFEMCAADECERLDGLMKCF